MTVHEIIKRQFLIRKRVNGYSLRALARDMKVSPAFMSHVLNGKKKLPISQFDALVKLLDIDSETAIEIRLMLKNHDQFIPLAPKKKISMTEWTPSSNVELSSLRQWFYVAILELCSTKGFDGQASSIAKKLEVSESSVEVALRDMISSGLLTSENGRIQKAKTKMRVSSAESKEQLRKLHKQFLKKAEEELSKTSQEDFNKRLITGISMTASPEKIALAKKMLNDSLHEIAEMLMADEGTEVYHLAAQLFPITKSSV